MAPFPIPEPTLPTPCGRKTSRRRFMLAAALTTCLEGSFADAKEADAGSGLSWVPNEACLADLESVMTVGSLPGFQVACVEGRRVIWARSMGMSDVKEGVRTTDRSLFEAASMSKPVFAYVVLRLADEKVIDIDRPLVEYWCPDYFPRSNRLDRITARDVLRHSSGLPNWGGEALASLVPQFEPGSAFRYSGEAYFWLQQVVEHVTNLGLEAIMQASLFRPLGLEQTTYTLTRRNLGAFAHGYEHGVTAPQHRRVTLERVEAVAARRNVPIEEWSQADFVRALRETDPDDQQTTRTLFVNAAASLLTTAAEYAKLTTLLMEGRKREDWEIQEKTRAGMLSEQIRITSSDRYVWGLGWSLERSAAGLLFAHGGNNDNRFKSFVVGHPKQGRAIVILTNGDSGDRIYERVIRRTVKQDLLGFLANLNPPLAHTA
jgi:CubicO group peptidase (beta-lactamase class C family)